MTASQASSDVSESDAACSTPAFRTTASRPPRREAASATDRSTAAASRASAWTKAAPGPVGDGSAALGVAAGEDDARALVPQPLDDRRADAGRAPRDESPDAVEARHGGRLSHRRGTAGIKPKRGTKQTKLIV